MWYLTNTNSAHCNNNHQLSFNKEVAPFNYNDNNILLLYLNSLLI